MTAAKIPTYVLIYHDPPTIKASLDWLSTYSDRLDLIVVENPSERTDGEIRPYVRELLSSGHIADYYLFDENISNNAFDVAVRADQERWIDAPFVILSDGDLVGLDNGWLDEEVELLTRHPDLFACGVSLDMTNLPVELFPAAVNWVPAPDAVHDDYLEGRTGVHLLMFRPDMLAGFLDHQRAEGLSFRDGYMHRYAAERGLRWARTKRATARHLTWDLYAQPGHPYREMKFAKSSNEHWSHARWCGFTTGEGRRPALPR